MSIGKSEKLKGLESRLKKAEQRRNNLLDEEDSLRSKKISVQKEIMLLESEVKQLKRKAKAPIVSEHAMLRYIERVIGIDMKELKQKILTESAMAIYKTMGDGKIPSEGCRLVVKDGVVVTVET